MADALLMGTGPNHKGGGKCVGASVNISVTAMKISPYYKILAVQTACNVQCSGQLLIPECVLEGSLDC